MRRNSGEDGHSTCISCLVGVLIPCAAQLSGTLHIVLCMAVWGLLPAQIGVVSSIYTGKLSLNGNTRKVGWATSSGTACGHLCCFQTHDTAPLQCDAHILMHASHDPHLYARCTCTIAGTPGSRMVGFSSNLAAGTHAIAAFFLLRRMSDTMALLSQGFTA